MTSEPQRFQVNLAGIIDLLSAHLYSGPDVYLRELLQNGVDALTARASVTGRGDAAWGVRARSIVVDGARVLEMEDDGVGLTFDEMERFLSTIGESSKRGTAEGFEAARAELLGQFGIGLLSCFMIGDEVVVTSRSARTASAPTVRWTGKSDGTYEVVVVEGLAHAIGTTVRIAPRRSMHEWVEPDRVRDLVSKFGSLLPWPIHVDDGMRAVHINAEPPPWQLDVPAADRARALLRFGEEVIGERPLDVIPLRSEAGAVEGAAFVHARARPITGRRGDRVYLKGMLLSERADELLPDWAFFVTAVVNARGLRPTASRESLYADEALDAARDELGDQIRAWLVDLAHHAPLRLDALVNIHHLPMKQLAAHDDEFLDVILDALPFETTHGFVAFGELARIASRTGELRYTSSRDAFRQMAPIARSEGIVLVNAAYVFETEILERAARARHSSTGGALRFVRVDAADLAAGLKDADADADAFRELAREALSDVGVDVSVKRFTPAALPSFFASSKDAELHRSIDAARAATRGKKPSALTGLLDDLDEPVKAARPEIVFNASCDLVQKLVRLAAADADNPLVKTAARVLYVHALMLGHHPLGPQELAIMNNGLVDLLEWGLASTSRIS